MRTPSSTSLTTSGQVRCVLFDLDGTLVDTPHAIARELAAAVGATTGTAPRDEAARRLIGLPLDVMVARLAPGATPPERAEAVADYRRRFRERIVPEAAALLYPGVVDGLARMHDAGLSLAVVTSKYHDSAVAILASAGIADAFPVVVGADDVQHPKPHAEHALHALRALGRGADVSVVVGDTAHDVQMARAAGMHCIGLDHGVDAAETLRSAGAHGVLSHLDALTLLLLDHAPTRT
ncbi:MAG: HAD family hydrolase [Propionibacteriales bacterium]|nr:HAD family hydrolase [Propionibacteriales bacterium]